MGQKPSTGLIWRVSNIGASLWSAMGAMQPIPAMQASVMLLQGFCPGWCWAIIFMQSSDMPAPFDADMVADAETAGTMVAKATPWPDSPISAPMRRRR